MGRDANVYPFEAQSFDARQVGFDRCITKAALALSWWLLETCLSVRRHQQNNTNTSVLTGLQDGFRHSIRFRVRLTIGLMVDVMEFSDRCITGCQHLTIGGQGYSIEAFGC